MDLEKLLAKSLSARQLSLLHQIVEIATEERMPLYLVGGAVRDIVLNLPVTDIDLVVEGDAVTLSQLVSKKLSGTVRSYPQFSTASLMVKGTRIDFARARKERYLLPAALPAVVHGDISDDLKRRDFSINAMAISIDNHKGLEIIDMHNGLQDIENKVIRILHSESFSDDPTRMLRGIRYEQRLGFSFDKYTENSISDHLPLLSHVSGERLMKEIEKWYYEEDPCKVICRADDLQILSSLHKSLYGIGPQLKAILQTNKPIHLDHTVWLGLMFHRLSLNQISEIESKLKFSKEQRNLIYEVLELYQIHKALSDKRIEDRALYKLLCNSSTKSVEVHICLARNNTLRENLMRFVSTLRHVKPIITGNEILNMGIVKSPLIGTILDSIRDARLDGLITQKQEEVDFVINNYLKK